MRRAIAISWALLAAALGPAGAAAQETARR